MKKLLLITVCLLGFFIKAQTEKETVDWLKMHQNEVKFMYGNVNLDYENDKKMEITGQYIKLESSSAKASVFINWKDVTKMTKTTHPWGNLWFVNIFNSKEEIQLGFESIELRDNFNKTLEHLVEKKGVKLLKN